MIRDRIATLTSAAFLFATLSLVALAQTAPAQLSIQLDKGSAVYPDKILTKGFKSLKAKVVVQTFATLYTLDNSVEAKNWALSFFHLKIWFIVLQQYFLLTNSFES
jgi:hypothetical protein